MLAQQSEWDGSLSGSRRWTEADTGGSARQDSITLNLNERGFIWRPWFATNRLQLYLQESWTEYNGDDSSDDQSSDSKLVSGSGFLTLWPQSRFATSAFADIYDLRVETNTVGVPLEEVQTLRRERFGATQHYRTEEGESNYAVEGVRTKTFTRDGSTENTDEYWVFGANRFENQSLNYRVSQRETERTERAEPIGQADQDPQDTFGTQEQTAFTVHHTYRPDEVFAAESALDGTRDIDRDENADRQSEISSAATFLTWRAPNAKWTARVSLSKQTTRTTSELDLPPQALIEPIDEPEWQPISTDLTLGTFETSQQDTYNGLTSFTYQITDNLQFSGDAGVTQTTSTDAPDSEQRFESATLAYAPAPIPLVGGLSYRWNTQGTVGNTEDSDAGSVQNYSAGAGHGPEFIASLADAMTLTLSAKQEGTRYGDTDGANLLELRHVLSGATAWGGTTSVSRTQVTYSHTRTTGVDPAPRSESDNPLGTPPDDDVDLLVESVYADASRNTQATRFSSVDGSLSAGRTRVDNKGRVSRFTFAHAAGGYTYHHVFNIDQFLFRTRLEYELHQTESETLVAVEDDPTTRKDERFVTDQELLSWDSRLDYIIGLLTLSLRRTVIAINGDYLRITVVSLTRRF